MKPILLLISLCLLVGCSATPDAPVPVNPAPFDGAIRIPVGDAVLEGTLYAAAGVTPHPTLVWLDDSPAPIEALRAAGLNVLQFHDGAVDPCESALAARAYLKNPEVARYYRVDADAIVSTDCSVARRTR
jgi:hypothetical protein